MAAALVVSVTAASVGDAIATLLTPAVAQLLTQMLIFAVMLFSPGSYPSDRLPGWLASIHEYLPIAQLIRAGLAPAQFDVPGRSLAVRGLWCIASVLGAVATLRRQG